MNGKKLGKAAAAAWIILITCGAVQAQDQSSVEQCPGEEAFIDAFNTEAASLNISDHDGHLCMIEDDHSNHTRDHDEGSSCSSVAQLVQNVIIRLDLTTEECLEHSHNDTNTRPSSAEAYGYGFLMVFIVCLVSLAGLSLLPVIYSKSSVGRQLYEYTYSFMIALAISALVSDAVLHLIPEVFNLHGHNEEDREYLWKACVVLAGIYMFYLLELFLHGLTDYLNKQKDHTTHGTSNQRLLDEDTRNETYQTLENNGDKPAADIEVVAQSNNNSPLMKETEQKEPSTPDPKICDLSCHRIRPVAWLIIIGDTMHNFGDGLAIGAAVSVSLSLGVSTSLAILFHEIPHELGDFAILIKSGMHWFTALMVNFLSAITAIAGLFIGVAVSQSTETANGWLLAITAGMFFYIGLVDLLPDLIHDDSDAKLTNHGWRWWLRLLVINSGFFTSFAVLLLIALYEDKIRF